MNLPKGWKYSMKQNDVDMLVMEIKMTKLAWFRLLLKAARGFDIKPVWVKPFAVLWVSVRLWLKGDE